MPLCRVFDVMQCPRVIRDDDLRLAFGNHGKLLYVSPARARSCGSDARLSCAVPVGVGACRLACL